MRNIRIDECEQAVQALEEIQPYYDSVRTPQHVKEFKFVLEI